MHHVEDESPTKPDGTKIKELKIRPENFLNRSCAIYGKSDSGKTVIMRNILICLDKFISSVFIFSPNEDQNLMFQDIVPRAAIQTEFEEKDIIPFVVALWKRQEASMIAYKKASNPEILVSLYKRIAKAKDDEQLNKIIDYKKQTEQSFNKAIDGAQSEEKGYYKSVKKCIIDHISLVQSIFFKKVIMKNERKLRECKLSSAERWVLDHVGINPFVVLIFDDCMHAIPMKVQKNKHFRDLFLAGRHKGITPIIAVHNRSNLDKTINDNLHRAIFATKQSASQAADRMDTTGRKEINEIKHITNQVFSADQQYRKLGYISNCPDPYRWLIAKFYPYEPDEKKRKYVGSKYVNKFLKSIESKEDTLAKGNQFAKAYGL